MALLIHDEAFLHHDSTPGHPESAGRLLAIERHLKERDLWESFERPDPRSATREEIERVHTPALFDRIAATAESPGWLDTDTHAGDRSFTAARMAAGAALTAADAIMAGEHQRAFCLVRPPGHHATRSTAMGFCLFNNIAICARHLRDHHGVSRVAVIDFDVHHGNGTEEIFQDDPDVFYLSLHRYPFYPGTGGPAMPGDKTVATLNVPLPADTTPEQYHDAFDQAMKEIDDFEPRFLLISAGFDAHAEDPIGGLGLKAEDFHHLTTRVGTTANRHAEGRIISTLEGGYHHQTLGPCVEQHLTALTHT